MGKHATKKTARTKNPKTKLGLRDLDHSKAVVLESLRSQESKRGYRHAIDEFIQWYCSEPRLSFNKIVVTRFRIALEARTVQEFADDREPGGVKIAYDFNVEDAGADGPQSAPRCECWRLTT